MTSAIIRGIGSSAVSKTVDVGSNPASPAKYQRLRFGNCLTDAALTLPFRRHPLNVKMRRFINSCKESFEELTKKTTWPTWAKLQSSALLVIIATVILAALLWVVDFAFQSLMTGIYTL